MKWWWRCCLALALMLSAILAVIPAGSAEMKVAIVSRTVFYVPLWIADHAGYFKEEGLELAIEVYDNAERINEDLRAGRVQIAVSTPESVVVDAYRGGSLRIVAGNAAKLPHFIIARPEIRALEHLRGARFGFNNLGAMLKYIPDYQFTSVNVDATWASQNRDMVVAFLRALRRGQARMRSDPTQAAELAAQELKTSLAFARRALEETEKLKILPDDLSVSQPGLSYVFDSLKSVGLTRISHGGFGIGRGESVKVVVRAITSADHGDPADVDRL